MDDLFGQQMVNTNPSQFEELAGVIATAYSYLSEGNSLVKLLDDFHHIYRRALSQPPCYSEVNEITGQSLSSGDRLAGKAAWLLLNIDQLQVYGVHSLLWHEVDGVHSAPLLNQMATALGVRSQLSDEDLKHMADDRKALIDIVGVKGDSI